MSTPLSPSYYLEVLKTKHPELKLRVLGTYINRRTEIEHQCLVCKNIRLISPGVLLYANPGVIVYCPYCSNTIGTAEVYAQKLKKLNSPIILLDDYTRSYDYLSHRCNKCNGKFSRQPNVVINNDLGKCPLCQSGPLKRKMLKSVFIKHLRELNSSLRLLDNKFNGTNSYNNYKCMKCSSTWYVFNGYLLRGAKGRCKFCNRGSNYSKLALEAINRISKRTRLRINTAQHGREHLIQDPRNRYRKFRLDGYNKRLNLAIEFYGDAYHGNPKKFHSDEQCHPFDKTRTASQLYKQTLQRERRLAQLGYKVIPIWESDYRNDPEAIVAGVTETIEGLKMSKIVIDKKTGRRRAVNQTKSRAAKAGARKRSRAPMSAATKAKIAKAVRKAHRTGKTKAGRKVIKTKRMGTKK